MPPMNPGRIELLWPGKGDRPGARAPRLVEEPAFGHGQGGDNLVIHGDGVQALRALEEVCAGRVQCVYLDPPYNTGAAFAQYGDDREHGAWLTLMRDTAEAVRSLLRPTGILLVSIGDGEAAYLKVLLDEVLGRSNYCGQFVWEKKKKPSFRDPNLGTVTEYVLAYARDRALSPAFVSGVTAPGKRFPLNNAGNGLSVRTFPARAVAFGFREGAFEPGDMSTGTIRTELLDPVRVRGGRNLGAFRLRGEWRYSQARLDALAARGETLYIARAPFRPNHVKPGGEPKKIANLLSIARYGPGTYEDAAEESRALFGEDAFEYPKPEGLIALLLEAVTRPGDLVLDAFAGSGTTGAVAHKLGRRWILVERGDHLRTHLLPRLRRVVDGTDPGGVTRAAGWRGGGGFRCFRLEPA